MATGTTCGAIVGFKDCALSSPPLLSERAESAFMLGLLWGSQTLFLPLRAIAKAECCWQGRDFDVWQPFKDAHRVATGVR